MKEPMNLSNPQTEQDLLSLMDKLRESPQIEMPVKHHYGDGQYLRETTIPKGTFVIGKKHRYSTINILIKGEVSVHNGVGTEVIRYKAPAIWTSKAGVQKIVVAHEDTVWCNPHPTDEIEPDKIEELFIISEQEQRRMIWDGQQ